ncbi:hypothetical protein ACIBI3_07435 [Actinomadura luteofluorescens]|uniref:hypothetical protein n=1 Tax=Actinomadura luteofluorescens TaxID=46163 RepID=UPI00349933BC
MTVIVTERPGAAARAEPGHPARASALAAVRPPRTCLRLTSGTRHEHQRGSGALGL